MSYEEAPSKLLDVWYSVDDQNLSLRTAILKPKALEAIHKMQRLQQKLLLFISLPESVKKEYLLKEWSKYEQLILKMKEEGRKEQDKALLNKANILAAELEFAKKYNTLPNLLDKLSILPSMLARMINATSAMEGKTFYGVLGYQQRRRKFSFFSRRREEEGGEAEE
jgi:hypothetical protein